MPPIVRICALWASATALVALAWVAAGPTPSLLGVAYLATATPWLVETDILEHRLPNALVLPAIVGGVIAAAGEWIVVDAPPTVPLLAGPCYAAFLLVLRLVGGMGMGDVKLGAALGLASWTAAVAVIGPVIAFLVGGSVAAVLVIAGQRERRIAFGPYLLGGFWFSVGLVALSRIPVA